MGSWVGQHGVWGIAYQTGHVDDVQIQRTRRVRGAPNAAGPAFNLLQLCQQPGWAYVTANPHHTIDIARLGTGRHGGGTEPSGTDLHAETRKVCDGGDRTLAHLARAGAIRTVEICPECDVMYRRRVSLAM